MTYGLLQEGNEVIPVLLLLEANKVHTGAWDVLCKAHEGQRWYTTAIHACDKPFWGFQGSRKVCPLPIRRPSSR